MKSLFKKQPRTVITEPIKPTILTEEQNLYINDVDT